MSNLKKIALLNGVTGGLDYLSKLLVTFFLNPYILLFVGDITFGVWKVLGQLNSYMAVGDLRAGTSLKWIVSKDRSIKEESELVRTVSTAFFSTLVLSPIYFAIGGGIIYFAPIVTGVDIESYTKIRFTAAILVLGFVCSQFFFLYESLLQAMNLSYKRMGVRVVIVACGGALSALVLYLGKGIIGLATVDILVIFVNGVTMYWIVKKNINWFKIVKVSIDEIKKFTSLSLMFLLQKLADLMSNMSDIVLLGYLAGPIFVTQYVFSLFAMKGLQGLTQIISTSVLPGLGKFYGEKDFVTLFKIRLKLIELKRMILTIGACVIAVVNQGFIALWASQTGQFVGKWESYLISLVIIIRTITLIDSSIINISLEIKNKIITSIFSGITVIALSFILIPYFSTFGLLLSLLIGGFIQSLFYASILKNKMGSFNFFKDLYYNRSFIAGNILILISVVLFSEIKISSWLEMIIISVVSSILFFAVYFVLALKRGDRVWFVNTIETVTQKNK